jgi:hypothetical protein
MGHRSGQGQSSQDASAWLPPIFEPYPSLAMAAINGLPGPSARSNSLPFVRVRKSHRPSICYFKTIGKREGSDRTVNIIIGERRRADALWFLALMHRSL